MEHKQQILTSERRQLDRGYHDNVAQVLLGLAEEQDEQADIFDENNEQQQLRGDDSMKDKLLAEVCLFS